MKELLCSQTFPTSSFQLLIIKRVSFATTLSHRIMLQYMWVETNTRCDDMNSIMSTT